MRQLHIFLALLIITLTLSNTANQNQLDRKAWRVQVITERWRLGILSLPCGSCTQVFLSLLSNPELSMRIIRELEKRAEWNDLHLGYHASESISQNGTYAAFSEMQIGRVCCSVKKGQNVGWGFREILDLIDIERTVHSNFKRNFTIFCRYKSTMNLETAK